MDKTLPQLCEEMQALRTKMYDLQLQKENICNVYVGGSNSDLKKKIKSYDQQIAKCKKAYDKLYRQYQKEQNYMMKHGMMN